MTAIVSPTIVAPFVLEPGGGYDAALAARKWAGATAAFCRV